VPDWLDGANITQTTARIPIDKSKANSDYIKYFLQSKIGQKVIANYIKGAAQPGLNIGDVRIFTVILPTSKEQTAIATALSDMDALIAQTEKLIEKKKAIKQGVMQELLRPKEGWVTKKLGDYGRTYGGITGKTKIDFGKGNSKYIPFMNIMSNPIIDLDYMDSVEIKPNEIQNKVLKGDLFFNGSSETPEEVGLCSVLDKDVENVYLNSFCFGYRMHNTNELNGLFISYLFRSPLGRSLIFSLAQGATRYNLSKTNLLKLELPIPNKVEQDNIALTLMDIDKLIQKYEIKLQKLKLQKQGMMQALLTGKIRLV
jgi:type I restriction enzyme S subunit